MSTTERHRAKPRDYVQLQINGELVAWEAGRQRTSFALLQRRVTAGRRLVEEVRRHPAYLVIFDLLQEVGVEMLRLPLAARRARLARLLADALPELPLCPQTTDRHLALAWYDHGGDVGIEGVLWSGFVADRLTISARRSAGV
jgi:ATP-dependent DNA ligase